jgi:hypothetical protein
MLEIKYMMSVLFRWGGALRFFRRWIEDSTYLSGSTRVRAWVVTSLVLACLSACHADTTAFTDRTAEITWPLGRSGAETLVLKVPNGYGELNQAAEAVNAAMNRGQQIDKTRGVNKELLLRALWPGLESDNGKNRGEFNQPGGGRLMRALLHSGAIDDFSERHFDATQLRFDVAIDESVHDLCVTQVKSGGRRNSQCYVRDAADVKKPKFGLLRLGVDFSKYPDFPESARSDIYARDIYYLRDAQGKLKTVILCTAEEAKTAADGPQYHIIPQCEHDFVSEELNAYVSLNYRRAYLQDWRTLEAAWRKLLESFVVPKKSINISVK